MRHVETFFPCIPVQPAKSGVQTWQPYFPGYVFGRLDLEAIGRSALDWLPGAIRIVSSGGDPVSVPDHIIQVLRQHVEAITRLATHESSRFHQGDLVMVQKGPFAGYEGIFNTHLPGRHRAEVLLMMLEGSQLRVELAIEHIAPVKK